MTSDYDLILRVIASDPYYMVWNIKKKSIKKILPRPKGRGEFIMEQNNEQILIKFNQRTATLQRIKKNEPNKVESIAGDLGNNECTVPSSGSARC